MIDLGGVLNSNIRAGQDARVSARTLGPADNAKDALKSTRADKSDASRAIRAPQNNNVNNISDNNSDADDVSSTRAEQPKFSDVMDRTRGEKPVSAATVRDNGLDAESSEPNQKILTPAEKAENNTKTKMVTREAAMGLFLDRMQSELGVEPTNILEAFSKLSASELVGPPEESAEKVIASLGLDEQKANKALGLYNEMLAMTAAAGMAQYLKQNSQQADVKVMNKKEADLLTLRQSIDNMNDRFFMTGSQSSLRTSAGMQDKAALAYAQNNPTDRPAQLDVSADKSNAQGQNKDFFPNHFDGQNKPIDLNGMTPVPETPVNYPMNADAGTAEAASDSKINAQGLLTPKVPQTQPNMRPEAISQPAPTVNYEALKAMAQNPNPSTISDSADEMTLPDADSFEDIGADGEIPALHKASAPKLGESQNPVQGLNSHMSGMGAGATSTGESNKDSKEKQDDRGLAGLGDATAKGHDKLIDNKAFTIGTPTATKSDVQTNVKEIISQAQFLARKGGGEMKVSLTPDGIGQVNLKVKMVNGQVNVEMITSNDEAKKLLEKGLGELKDNLAMHKLHLDTIRIDGSKDISNQLAQQQHDQENKFQQRFLSDFRDNNQNFRRDLYEMGEARIPGSQTRDRAMNDSYTASSKKRDPARRLDLVA